MRINLKTTPSQMCIPFNYQPKLVGTLHNGSGRMIFMESLQCTLFRG